MPKHRMRCGKTRKCGYRFALARHPDTYKRPLKCPQCGNPNVYSDEATRQKQVRDEETCRCDAYPFPHRKGSMRFCAHHPQIYDAPSQDDISDYESLLETPRGHTC